MGGVSIFPAYLLTVFSCAILLSFVSSYSFVDYFTRSQLFKYLLANLTFLNFVEPCLPGVFTSDRLVFCSVNGSLWTLKIEVGFYLVVPILLCLTNKIKRKYIVLLIIYVLAVLYHYALRELSASTGISMFSTLSHQLPRFMSYFACGIALHYYFDFFIKNKNRFLFAGIILFAFEKYMGWEILTPFALSAVVFGLAYSLKGLNNFGKYGDISYGIYIYHFPIMQIAVNLGYFDRYNPFLVAGAIILMVVILGFLSWHLLEKKFLKR